MEKVEALKVLKPDVGQLSIKDEILQNQIIKETKKEIVKICEIGKLVNRGELVFKIDYFMYNIQRFQITWSFSKNIF